MTRVAYPACQAAVRLPPLIVHFLHCLPVHIVASGQLAHPFQARRLRELGNVFLHIASLAVLDHDAVSRGEGQGGVDFCVLDCLVDAPFIAEFPGEVAFMSKRRKKTCLNRALLY